jgi:hypothetical protein
LQGRNRPEKATFFTCAGPEAGSQKERLSRLRVMSHDPDNRSPDPERRQDAVLLGRRALGPGLRRMFDEVVSTPAPEEWLELLRKAEDAQGERRA